MSRRYLLFVLGVIGLFGVGLALWSGIGDASVVAGTGGVYEALERHGLGDNAPLRNELYSVVLRLQQPWSTVRWMSLVVVALSVVGFAIAWRTERE